jgi:hypothetical protein
MSSARSVRTLLVALVATAVSAGSVSAQAPARNGFFIGFGFGGGSFGVEDADTRETSVSGYFRIGGALNDKVLLGAESSAWTKDEGGATITSSALSAMVYVYPNPAGGFFLQGGLGIATLELEVDSFGSGSDTGTALTVGAGYDIGFGGRFGLTPYTTFVFSNFEDGSTSLFNLGLGFNWY